MEANRPERKFKAGAVTATIWRNVTEKGSYASIQISRNYKDKNDTWQTSNSLRAGDIPKAALVLQKAYEYLTLDDNQVEVEAVI